MIKHEIVLGHKISKKEIEVDRAKIEVIAKLLMPKCVKAVSYTHLTLPTIYSV